MKFVIISLCLLAIVVCLHEASATRGTITASCSHASANSATGGTILAMVSWNLHNSDPTNGCYTSDCGTGVVAVTDANYCGVNFAAKSPVNFWCAVSSTGVAPPTLPTTITISAYADQTSNGGGGSPVWTTSFVSCPTLANSTTFSKSLTTDGGAASAAKSGTLRLFVRIQNTGVGTSYDCNSDDAGSQTAPTGGSCNSITSAVGVVRSNPGFSAENITAGSPCASGCHTYIGGDSIVQSMTDNASSYSASFTYSMSLNTGGLNTPNGGVVSLSTGANTRTITVQGSAATWLSGSITLQYGQNGFSSIVGYSGLSGWIFTSATTSGATLVNAHTITFDPTDTLDRSLTEQSHCAPPSSVVNRGQTISSSCQWKDARGTSIPNTKFGRTWVQRGTQYRVSTDVGSSDTSFTASQGELDASNVVTTSATVTTGSAYRFFGESFDLTGRTDASLNNWGNSTNQIDVSSTYKFDSLLNSKTSGGANTTSFTISADTEHAKAVGLRDASGNALTGIDVTCFRTRPDQVTESNVDFGNTGAGGTTNDFAYTVAAPAGTWKLTCNVASNGNTGTYQITFFFVSAFTADKEVSILWNVTVNTTNTANVTANITARFTFYDVGASPATDSVACAFPDDVVRLGVFAYQPANNGYLDVLQNRTIMNSLIRVDGSMSCAWYYTFDIPIANLTRGAFAYATLNFTGSAFLGSEAYKYSPVTCTGCSVDIMGAVTFPAYDPYIPTIVWLIALIILLYKRVYYPTFACTLNIADQLLSYNHLTNAGFFWEIALFVFTILLQAIARFIQDPRLLPTTKSEENEGD